VAAVTRGGVAGAALGLFGGLDQVAERFLRSASQLSAQSQCYQAAPPPGREVEVSIEPDERSAFLDFGEG
jgi:hypothetical protein